MNKALIATLRLWNGNEKLSFAFWSVFVPIFFFPIIFPIVQLAASVFITVITVLIFIALKIFSLVALWRCAPNVSYNVKLKSGLAKSFVILNVIIFVFLGLILFFILVTN